jgi:O-antigen ligase
VESVQKRHRRLLQSVSSGPPKIDPWEAREREREKWNNPRRSRRRHRSADLGGGNISALQENYLPLGLIVALALLLLSEVPQIIGDARMIFAQAGTFLILILLGTCRSFLDDMRVALRRGPNPLLLLLVAWAGYAFFESAYRTIAAADLLRILAGVGAYFLAAYTLRTPRQMSYVIMGLLAIGISISLYDMGQMGQQRGVATSIDTDTYSIFGTHGNVGSLLVLMAPVALSFAIHGGIEEKRRLTALAATLVLGGALLVARTRAAWVGALFAFVTLSILYLIFGPKEEAPPRGRRSGGPRGALRNMLASPAAMIAAGFLLMVVAGGLAPFIGKRVSLKAMRHEATFSDRLILWRGAVLMAAEKPLTGWGMGNYLVNQAQWTHEGDEAVIVLRKGADQNNMAHNYYVQWAADTGSVGLLLHVAVVFAFLLTAIRGMRTTRTPFQTALLAGSCASIVGASVDAAASPAYNFHGVSTVFWVWMGLGVAALRPLHRKTGEPTGVALGPTSWTVWTGAIAGGVAAAASVLLWAFALRTEGASAPRGLLQISSYPSGPIQLGTSVLWTARFTDGRGRPRPTLPGTVWTLHGDPAMFGRAEAEMMQRPWSDKPDNKADSVYRLLMPRFTPVTRPVAIQASYRDQYGRRYEAWSMKEIKAAAPRR